MKKKKKSKKRRLTKDDVGIPHDFRHVSHLSWNADDGPHVRYFLLEIQMCIIFYVLNIRLHSVSHIKYLQIIISKMFHNKNIVKVRFNALKKHKL